MQTADAQLLTFLLTGAACGTAAAVLRAGAEVAVTFTDLEGDFRICKHAESGIALEAGKALDPDFELRIPPRALQAICARTDADMGDLGVIFFEHIIAKDPLERISVTVHSGLVKLTRRGWLGLLARGGPTVMMWMAQKGLRGPGSVANALGRFKKS
jgi:hypothetical protein